MPLAKNGVFYPEEVVLTARRRVEYLKSEFRKAWPLRHNGKNTRRLIKWRIDELRVAKIRLYGEEE